MTPAHWSGMFSTAEAAALLGVRETTIRQWRYKKTRDAQGQVTGRVLEPQGLDERNRPLHTAEALWEADALVRRHGKEASGIDPRALRGLPAPARKPRGAGKAGTAEAAA